MKTCSLGDLLEPDKGVAWLPIGRTRNKSTNPELTELVLKSSSLGDLLEPDKGVVWLPIGRTRNESTNPELTELALKTSSLGDLLEPDKGGVADRSQDVLHDPGLPFPINIIVLIII
jgi:hypothetical protein